MLKTNFKHFSFIVLFFFLSIYAYSIDNTFKNGYIISLNGDTIYGLLQNNNYYSNSKECFFIEEGSTDLTKYYPFEIIGYQFSEGKYYVSRTVELEKKNTDLFLEFLVNGELDVYFHQDDLDNNHYFIEKKDQPLRELYYLDKIVYKNGVPYSHPTTKHRGILRIYTDDSPSLEETTLNFGEPTHKNLIRFSKKYHQTICDDYQCIVYEKSMPIKVKINPVTGIDFAFEISNSIKIDDSYMPYYGFNVFLGQNQISENIYIGLGVINYQIGNQNYLRIPFSVNYMQDVQGFSPTYSYVFDLDTFISSQGMKVGVKFQKKKLALLASMSLRTMWVVFPFAIGPSIGLTYNFYN
ncbi:MAG: hypothetical protein PF487_06175 [Bacteroidales bacterium]|jgi:hypothetical protein|nr:hypothetical protein [Bacteroidales bacterium]